MQIKAFTFNPFQENTYVLACPDTKQAAIVDPGCYEPHEKQALQNLISQEGYQVTHLLNTHCHIDHVLGNAFVKQTYEVPLLAHKEDEMTLNMASVLASNYGFDAFEESTIDQYIDQGTPLKVGNLSFEIFFVPGHAPGHVVFYYEPMQVIIGGDVLFYESIGRTDLPGGDHNALITNIKEKLFTLPDDVTVLPGHGQETTIGHEKAHNPFLR